jgi:hypothetical protein
MQIPNKYLELDNLYIINNSTNLAHDIVKLKINRNHRFITYDIKDLFVNIPIQETLTITDKLLQLKAVDPICKTQILQLMKVILSQNYFTFTDNIYQPINKKTVYICWSKIYFNQKECTEQVM